MFCQFCGTELPDDAVFCSKCGKQCSEEVEQQEYTAISFDDELIPAENTPKQERKAPTATEKKETHRNLQKGKEDLKSEKGSSQWRVMHENGSSNVSIEFFDGILFAVVFIPKGDELLTPLTADGKTIVSENVRVFRIGKSSKQIFYLTEDRELFACDFSGSKRRQITGGNGDRVLNFAVNDDTLFLLLQGKDSEISLFKIPQTLDSSAVLKTGYHLHGLAVNEKFLYYIDGTVLTQYNLSTGAEKVILDRTGLNSLQLYNGYLVLNVSDNIYSTSDSYSYILLLDPIQMLQRRIVQGAAKCVNCYWDHVFYIDRKTERIWAVSLNGGEPHLLRDKSSDLLNLACGQLYFVDCANAEFTFLDLTSGEEKAPSQGEMPKAQVEAIRYSLLNQGAAHYRDYTLKDALLEGISIQQDIDPRSELFKYVVFLTLPQFNRNRENISALLNAADYHPRSGSTPIIFVDTTTFCKRSKGFVVATDGVYTSTAFFPYDHTFDCERSGLQQITLTTYEKVRFGSEKRTLKIDCPMFKDGLDTLSGLIYTIYAFSYFTGSSLSDRYLLPAPKDLSGRKKPGYIKAPKKSNEEIERSDAATQKEAKLSAPSASVTKKTIPDASTKAAPKVLDEGAKEEMRDAFNAEMDQLWRSKPIDALRYNAVKVFLEFVWSFIPWSSLIVPFNLLDILDDHIESGILSGMMVVLLLAIGIVIDVVIGFRMWNVCETLNEKISGEEGAAIRKKYEAYGIETSYTPIGIRGDRNVVAIIACFILSLLTLGWLINHL